MRRFAHFFLVLGLAASCLADEDTVLLRVESFPPGAQVYQETPTGPTYVGICGQELRLRPPALRDPAGRRVQFTAGSLTLVLPDHQKRHVTIQPDQWREGRLPPQGTLKLSPDNLWIGFQDYARAYPLGAIASAGVGLGLLLLGLHWRQRLRQQSVQVAGLLGRLELQGDPLLGKSLGEYVVQSRLGQGGMGTVYKVRGKDGQSYAAKVFYSAPGEELNEARFRREARVISQLNHPNLIRCYDYGDQPGLIYYVMELVDGHTLEGQIRPGGRPWNEVWALVDPVIRGLEYAHNLGVAHRDLKPANIMVATSGQIKVLDFGLAREMDRTAVTGSGQAMGTPTYLAPEQITLSGGQVEVRTDQYSLGILLFELLTGTPPFVAEAPEKLIFMHLSATVPRVRSRRPDLPVALDQAISRMLEKDPERRFETMGQVHQCLEQIPRHQESPAQAVAAAAAEPDPTIALARRPRPES